MWVSRPFWWLEMTAIWIMKARTDWSLRVLSGMMTQPDGSTRSTWSSSVKSFTWLPARIDSLWQVVYHLEFFAIFSLKEQNLIEIFEVYSMLMVIAYISMKLVDVLVGCITLIGFDVSKDADVTNGHLSAELDVDSMRLRSI